MGFGEKEPEVDTCCASKWFERTVKYGSSSTMMYKTCSKDHVSNLIMEWNAEWKITHTSYGTCEPFPPISPIALCTSKRSKTALCRLEFTLRGLPPARTLPGWLEMLDACVVDGVSRFIEDDGGAAKEVLDRYWGGTITGVARGGGGHWVVKYRFSWKNLFFQKKQKTMETYPPIRLIEMQSRPRRVFLFEFDDMVFQELKSRQQCSRRWRHCWIQSLAG